jgi:acyl-CoA synthetase (AMP-forming)/AMP-acid ligase II/NAD(P)-dependent dehydrogenase (short-subunit alcohol dehydrogenase family)
VGDAPEMSELLPRPVRLLIGATSAGTSDAKLRRTVEGKIALITGASSGVGEASARRLAAAGATVLLVARREEVLEEIRSEIAAAGGTAFVHPCDLSDVEQAGALAEEVLARYGHVDIVVSNAGLSIRRWVSESYDRFRDIERTINTNYLGPVRLLLGLLDSMRERGSGHIVAVATVGVAFPPMRWSAYIASKAAFETWLAGVAPEARADGVTTTSIHLQLVRSPMLGPFKMWSYLPGMSSDEAAGIVARAIVQRPRTIAPLWGRVGSVTTNLAQAPLEAVLARYARRTNPDSRRRAQASEENSVIGAPVRLAGRALGSLGTVASSGMVRPIRPDRIARALLALRRFGPGPGAGAAAAAALYGERPGLVDERGTLTFGELDRQARALACSLHGELGLTAEDRIALMCRNHRGYVQAAVAASRLGCDLVPLNTDFAGPQLGEVLGREGVTAAIHDEEFDAVFDASEFAGARVLAWHDGDSDGNGRADAGRPTVDALIATGRELPEPPTPLEPGRIITLTSGTTGTPKGATRTIRPLALAPAAVAAALDLGRITRTPRSGEAIVVAPPLFHLFGTVGMLVAFAYGSPMVLRRKFGAEATLEQIERTRAGMVLAVPTMLARIMDLPDDVRDRHDTSSLRMLISGAAPLAPELATSLLKQFGPVLYNGYASTEVGTGTLATPEDLRAAPGTVGRPMAGTTVKVLGEDGAELSPGETGRVFIGSPLVFEGYTGGGSKEMIGGLMCTGDVGHFDAAGRLFIDGRDDDMIVSGGENVFPQEVEELLLTHEAVADAAVFGVPDPDFGQRLAAFVVAKDGSSVSGDDLGPYVRERLARYKVPREFTVVDELPRTSTGKLQRRRLAERHQAHHA